MKNENRIKRGLPAFLALVILAGMLCGCVGPEAPGKKETPTVMRAEDRTPKPTEEVTATPEPLPTLKPFDPAAVEKKTMPRLDIVTDNGKMIEGTNLDQPLYASHVSLSSCAEEFAFSDLTAEVRVRGNSTATAEKKPYKLKFTEKQSVLGLNNGKSFKSWVLLADYFDDSMLRNWSAFRLTEDLFEGKWYVSDCAHVEVYVNGQYQGVYLLCEPTQIKKNRINIANKEDEDRETLETGYVLVGQGGIWWEENYFDVPIGYAVKDHNGKTMDYGSIRFVLAGGDDYSDAQRKYVSDYVSAAFRVIKSAVYDNIYYSLDKKGNISVNRELTTRHDISAAEKQRIAVEAVLDVEAALRMCVCDEIFKNLDAMTFNIAVDLSPEGDGRLVLMAPWDFDHAVGKTHYSSTHSTSGWYATDLSVSDGVRVNFLYVMLGNIDWFAKLLEETWRKYYPVIREFPDRVLEENYTFEDAFERDWEKWGGPVSRSQTGHNTPADDASFRNHTDAAKYVAEWLRKRISWLNRQWGDGSETVDPVVRSPLLIVDFTKPESRSYVSQFFHCEGTWTDKGLVLRSPEAYDPGFYFDLEGLPEEFDGCDYPFIEIVCEVPASCKKEGYTAELFLCAGSVEGAQGGISQMFPLKAPGTGMQTYRLDLGETGFWSGTMHRIRFDYYASCEASDTFVLKSISLLPE